MVRLDFRWLRYLSLVLTVTLCTSVSADDYTDAQYAIRSHDYQRAFALLDKLARAGHADAQYQLAAMYRAGRGVGKDHDKAAAWYRKAAEQGHAKAQYNLGVMYENGWGVARDPVQAMHWYKLAADQGHKIAVANLDSTGDSASSGGGYNSKQEDTDQLHRASSAACGGSVWIM